MKYISYMSLLEQFIILLSWQFVLLEQFIVLFWLFHYKTSLLSENGSSMTSWTKDKVLLLL